MDALSWLRPGLLWGLAALAVPVIIHLLGRNRRRTVKFATVRFLERAAARASARLKLKRLLLLLARMLLVALLVALAAGPGLKSGSASKGVNRVLVADVSWSMQAKTGGASALERESAQMMKMLESSVEGDRFALVTTSVYGRDSQIPFTDASAARDRIKALLPDPVDGGAAAAVERAQGMLRAAGGGEVFVFTDMQRFAWRGLAPSLNYDFPVKVVDVGGENPQNGWLDRVEQSEATIRVVPAASGGLAVKSVRLTLADGRKLTSFTENGYASFRPGATEDGGAVTASLEPGGDLAEDDALPFVTRPGGPVRVLLVNGDPRGFEIMDELLFVRRAFAAGGQLARRFDVREIRQAELSLERLADVDAALLANPAPLTQEAADAVLKRVREGMGLIVTAGDGWNPERQGDSLSALLPAPLRDRIAARQGGGAAVQAFEELDAKSLAGPLEKFGAGGEAELAGVKVQGYWISDVGPKSGVAVLARLGNQVPLLVERPEGKGRLVLLATSIDRDWSDLCLRPAFIPFLERVLQYAAGRAEAELPPYAIVGAKAVSPLRASAVLISPDGRETPWEPGGEGSLVSLPGVYRVKAQGRVTGGFVGRVDPEESNLERLRADEIATASRAAFSVGREATGGSTGRSDVSAQVAAGLLAALAVEALLTMKTGRRRSMANLGEGGA